MSWCTIDLLTLSEIGHLRVSKCVNNQIGRRSTTAARHLNLFCLSTSLDLRNKRDTFAHLKTSHPNYHRCVVGFTIFPDVINYPGDDSAHAR